jgi:hypothetical protein
MRLIVGIRPAPGQHSPAPPPKDEAAGAREDLELEQILKGGYDAYMAGKDTDRKMMEQLFARFPERAWLWLRDMSASDTYAENRYRDLAEHWPADKFASDVPRMLRGDAKERAFGLALGRQWLRSDPEAAIPYLFSRHQNLGNTWRDALPFHIFIYQKKWDRERILAFMDKIEDPVWRDLVRRETVLYFILNDPGPEGLKSLLALEKPEDIDRVIGRFVRYRIRGDGHVQFLDSVIALGPEHSGIRERMLELMPAALVDADDGDKSLIPKIVEAIRDPVARVRALEGSPAYRIPATIGERILLILAGCPAGKSRDEQINSAIERIPVADRVAILEKTDNPMLRARILARLPNAGQFEEREFRICIAALESLPPEWKDEDLADKWMMDQATRDPSKWGQALNRHLARKKDTGLLYSTMDRWVKSNPQAALQAIYESGPQSATSGWIVPALLAIHQNDNQAVLRHLRSRPEATRRALTEHFSQWARTSPSAACAASLLVMPDDLRLKIFHSSFQTWVAKQPDDAMRWSKGLPTGRERLGAIHNLATYLDGKGLAPPEWLKSEVPERFEKREPPPRRTPEEFAEEGRKFRAAEESRLARQRTAASIRALALLDENEVIVKVKDLPDGPQKVDSLFGLLEHAAASGNANLREQVAKQLAATDGVPSTEIATTVMNHLPLEDLDAAIGFEREIADPKARETCSSILLHRWSEPKHRDRLTRWIREYHMVDRRLALADTYIRGMLRPRQDASGRTPPASASPELDALLRESITAWARLELAHALLDHRAPHPLSLGHSGLDADVIRETRAAIERQQSEKRYQSAPSQP